MSLQPNDLNFKFCLLQKFKFKISKVHIIRLQRLWIRKFKFYSMKDIVKKQEVKTEGFFVVTYRVSHETWQLRDDLNWMYEKSKPNFCYIFYLYICYILYLYICYIIYLLMCYILYLYICYIIYLYICYILYLYICYILICIFAYSW